jgi:lipopolysaccharide/colanic/teichoic acid biosynthesis glycosyltransferase
MDSCKGAGLTIVQRWTKRGVDMVFSLLGLLVVGWIIPLAALVAWIDTGESGFYCQIRVGYKGRLFSIIKIRTMRTIPDMATTVSRESDPRITPTGRFLRRTKLDEIPQLINILLGDMSFVGPRPDVPGFADRLQGEDRVVLSVRPGITGPASLKYRKEERLLDEVQDPEHYNMEVVFPDKVRINRAYVEEYSLFNDVRYICRTLFGR